MSCAVRPARLLELEVILVIEMNRKEDLFKYSLRQPLVVSDWATVQLCSALIQAEHLNVQGLLDYGNLTIESMNLTSPDHWQAAVTRICCALYRFRTSYQRVGNRNNSDSRELHIMSQADDELAKIISELPEQLVSGLKDDVHVSHTGQSLSVL